MPAPARQTPIRTESTALSVPKGIVGVYTDLEVDALLAGLAGGGGGLQTVDLSAYATIAYVDGKLATVYTKAEVDAALAAVDLSAYAKLTDPAQSITAKTITAEGYAFGSLEKAALAYADTGEGYGDRLVLALGGTVEYVTLRSDLDGLVALLDDANQTIVAQESKVEAVEFRSAAAAQPARLALADVNGVQRLAVKVNTKTFPLAFLSEVGGGPAVDMSAYAAKVDAAQSILAKTITAEGYGFGSTMLPAAALAYTDTGEGYGTRLVLAVGDTIEYIPYMTDFGPLRSRLDALESRLTPTASTESVDLAPYAKTDWVVAWTEAMKNDSTLKMQAMQAEVGTVASAVSTNTDKLAALQARVDAFDPVSAPSIDSPNLAEFKKSVLEAVALMMAGGGKQPPPDLPWTRCLNGNGVGDHGAAEVRMIAGMIEFRGVGTMSSANGNQAIFQLPASFPFPELACSYPVAARLAGSSVQAAYVWFTLNSRTVGISASGTINEYTLTGLRVKAAY